MAPACSLAPGVSLPAHQLPLPSPSTRSVLTAGCGTYRAHGGEPSSRGRCEDGLTGRRQEDARFSHVWWCMHKTSDRSGRSIERPRTNSYMLVASSPDTAAARWRPCGQWRRCWACHRCARAPMSCRWPANATSTPGAQKNDYYCGGIFVHGAGNLWT